MIRIIENLVQDWRYLDEGIDCVTGEIESISKSAEPCRHLMTIPGIGPIISSAITAAAGNGAAFVRGRDFAAWLGLVPKQLSTGGRTILGRITKRGSHHPVHRDVGCVSPLVPGDAIVYTSQSAEDRNDD
jgi:transposase